MLCSFQDTSGLRRPVENRANWRSVVLVSGLADRALYDGYPLFERLLCELAMPTEVIELQKGTIP